MPRSVDLSQLPPAQAVCYGCQQDVALSPKARARSRFRCPLCHSDNRVDQTGLGRPLRGLAPAVEDLPVAACPRCHAENRLPASLLGGKRYTCHACRRIVVLPRELRVRQTVLWPWVTGVVLVLLLCVVSIVRQGRAFVRDVDSRLQSFGVEETAASLDLEDGRAVDGVSGRYYEVNGKITNHLDRPATLHVRFELLNGDTPVLASTVSLRAVPAGATRPVRLRLLDPQRRAASQPRAELLGVS